MVRYSDSGFGADRLYVVQTLPRVIERCVLMTTDPGDLVLDLHVVRGQLPMLQNSGGDDG